MQRHFNHLLTGLVCIFLIIIGNVAPSLAVSHSAPTFQLGLLSGDGNGTEGQTAQAWTQIPFGYRYHYLSGGVNTGNSWQSWGEGGGSFVSSYISESVQMKTVPVFTYYQIRQSLPGANISNEQQADLTNLNTPSTMLAYYNDLKTFFQKAAPAGPTILQIEPDLWGYIEQAANNNNASTIPASVSSSGMPDLRGMPNTAAGFAEAILTLRRNYDPTAKIAYSLSIWGTGKDIHLSHPSPEEVTTMASMSSSFYHSLDTHFDMFFSEVANADAGYAQNVEGEGTTAWWSATDYARDVQYLAEVHKAIHLSSILWQIPLGNTVMKAMNNTPYHYQDNHVQWLIGPGSAAHLAAYAHAGVTAFLFGSGQPTGTDAGNNSHQGILNPAAIDGNITPSYNNDDDGGFFMARARDYYKHPFALR